MKTKFYSASALVTSLFLLTAGMAAAQTAPNSAALSFWTAPSVPAGSQNVAVAMFVLDASNAGQNIFLRTMPLNVQYSGSPAYGLTNCFVENTAAHGYSQTGPGVTLGASGATFTFSPAASVLQGTSARFALVCSVSAAASAGSSVTLSVNPSAMSASGANGAVVPIVAAVGASSPIQGSIPITAPVVTLSGSTTGSSGGTPGVPNTGAGGDALATSLILAVSLLTAYGGSVLARRLGTRTVRRQA